MTFKHCVPNVFQRIIKINCFFNKIVILISHQLRNPRFPKSMNAGLVCKLSVVVYGSVQRHMCIGHVMPELRAQPGIGTARAAVLKAAVELGRRVAGSRPERGRRLGAASDVWDHYRARLAFAPSEEFWVLEDNARTPSGVSYMLENRDAMMRLCPELFELFPVRAVEPYPELLRDTLISVAPQGAHEPTCVVLTPGHHNSAFYEHSFLADNMGIELVEGSDLQVDDDIVYMLTIDGPVRVDVIYRRIDDAYLDPLVFNPDSVLGVRGLMAAYLAGNVTLVNAPGTGIADDKAIYSYMPEIVRYYTGEDARLPNVETFRCREPDMLQHCLDNIDQLVVKLVDGSGGYGMLVGPTATKQEIEEFSAALKAEPHRYIAQPTLALSTVPTLTDKGIAPRHVDFRPFVLTGAKGVTTVPGGLTRVALREGSLVVNSSQGGGTKDSFILDWDGEEGAP